MYEIKNKIDLSGYKDICIALYGFMLKKQRCRCTPNVLL